MGLGYHPKAPMALRGEGREKGDIDMVPCQPKDLGKLLEFRSASCRGIRRRAWVFFNLRDICLRRRSLNEKLDLEVSPLLSEGGQSEEVRGGPRREGHGSGVRLEEEKRG